MSHFIRDHRAFLVGVAALFTLILLGTRNFWLDKSDHLVLASSYSAPQDIPIIESSHPYANSYDNTWIVANNDPHAVATRLHFARLELEDRVDYIIITDVDGREFQRVTGVYMDGLWTDPIVGRYVKVRLVTDTSVGAWGFAVDRLQSVDYPSVFYSTHPYANNSNQEWTFSKSSCSGTATKIHFARVDLEDGVDWLIINDISDREYQRLTGSHPSGVWTVAVPGPGIKVKLVSDYTVVKWGFHADQIECGPPATPVPAPTPGPVLAETEHWYNPGINQTWTIVNPNSAAASSKIHFRDMVLGNNSRLYIEDVEGRVMAGYTQRTFSGENWSDYVPGHIVKVQLVGNGTSAWGFQIDGIVDAEPKPVLAETEHWYDPGINQTWTIANPNSTATSSKVHFRNLTLGNNSWLYIRDVAGRIMAGYTQRTFSGEGWSDYVPGNIVKVQLVGNGGSHFGFQIDDIVDAEPKPVLAETEHWYNPQIDQTWVIVNPNAAATSSKIHFRQLILGDRSRLYLQDVAGRLMQTFNGPYGNSDFWSDDVTGQIVNIRLVGNGGSHFGFQIDDIQPQGNATPVPAFIGGVYVTLNAPGTVYLNDQEVFRAGQPGEYKIRIPGYGKHMIRIEYLEAIQNVEVTLGTQLTIVYLPLVQKTH